MEPQQPASAVIRERLYVCGGWNPGDGRITSSASRFDPLQKRWRSLRPMSVLRARAAVGDHMYVCGGVDDSFRPHNAVERFDTLSEVWEVQQAMARGRWGASTWSAASLAVVQNARVPSSALTVHGPRLPPMTRRRVLCTTAVVARKLHVSGGVVSHLCRAPDTFVWIQPSKCGN